MANTIRILRSASTNTPASLLQGELANSELGSPNAINELFIGTAGPTVFKLIQNNNGQPAQPTSGLSTATMTGSDWIVFDDAGTPARALISGINLSLFNDDVVSGNYVTSVTGSTGITIGGTATAPSVAIDYLGVNNFIDSATNLEGTGINIADTIVYHDATDDNVKKGLISDIPVFTSSTVGFATASGGGTTNYLRADGTWASPPGGAASNSFETMTVTDTDSGFTWAETGSAVASISTDTLTFVSGTDIDIDVDATSQAIRVAFTNASGYTTNAGTVTSVTAGTGLGQSGTSTINPTLFLAVDELAEKTGTVVGTDRLVGTTGTTNWAETINQIPIGLFDNSVAEYVSENDTMVVADWNWVLDEDTMSSDSNIHVPTQQSVKAYVDNAVSSGVTYKGAFDPTAGAGAGSPDLDAITSATGDMYTVTVAGTYNWTTGSAILEVGDVLIAEADGVLNNVSQWTIVQQNLSAATISTPGYVSVGAQTFGGTKTFEDISGDNSGATIDSFIIDCGTF